MNTTTLCEISSTSCVHLVLQNRFVVLKVLFHCLVLRLKVSLQTFKQVITDYEKLEKFLYFLQSSSLVYPFSTQSFLSSIMVVHRPRVGTNRWLEIVSMSVSSRECRGRPGLRHHTPGSGSIFPPLPLRTQSTLSGQVHYNRTSGHPSETQSLEVSRSR